MQTKKEKRKNAEVSITGTLAKERIKDEIEKVLARIAREVALPGFRKGKVPLPKVREYVGEKALWREATEAALKAEAEAILKEHEVLPIMPVSIVVTSDVTNTDVPFEIIAVVAPTCEIGGYRELSQRALEKVTENTELQEKRRAIAEALIAKANCDIPCILIAQEARTLLEATKKDIARQGLPWNEYLKRTGKTEEAILTELQAPAEKRVSLDIIFGKIAQAEKLELDKEEEDRLAHVFTGQGVEHETAHRYIRAAVMREKVWELLLGAKSQSAVS